MAPNLLSRVMRKDNRKERKKNQFRVPKERWTRCLRISISHHDYWQRRLNRGIRWIKANERMEIRPKNKAQPSIQLTSSSILLSKQFYVCEVVLLMIDTRLRTLTRTDACNQISFMVKLRMSEMKKSTRSSETSERESKFANSQEKEFSNKASAKHQRLLACAVSSLREESE